MPLKKCKECGAEVSDRAEKCPNCGCPTKVTSNKGLIAAIIVVALIIVGGIVYFLIPKSTESNPVIEENSIVEQSEVIVPVNTKSDIENFGLRKGITSVMETNFVGESSYNFSPDGSLIKIAVEEEGYGEIFTFEGGKLVSSDETYVEELGDDVKREHHVYDYETIDPTHTNINVITDGRKSLFAELTLDDKGRVTKIARYKYFGTAGGKIFDKTISYDEDGNPTDESGNHVVVNVELIQELPLRPYDFRPDSSQNTYYHQNDESHYFKVM